MQGGFEIDMGRSSLQVDILCQLQNRPEAVRLYGVYQVYHAHWHVLCPYNDAAPLQQLRKVLRGAVLTLGNECRIRTVYTFLQNCAVAEAWKIFCW